MGLLDKLKALNTTHSIVKHIALGTISTLIATVLLKILIAINVPMFSKVIFAVSMFVVMLSVQKDITGKFFPERRARFKEKHFVIWSVSWFLVGVFTFPFSPIVLATCWLLGVEMVQFSYGWLYTDWFRTPGKIKFWIKDTAIDIFSDTVGILLGILIATIVFTFIAP